MIEATVTGNVLESPTQKVVTVKGESVRVTELRVMNDVYRRNGDELVQDDTRTSPVGITIWSETLGNRVMNQIKRGMRVVVSGELHMEKWEPNSDQAAAGKKSGAELRMTGNSCSVALNRVESITMTARQERPDASVNSGADASTAPQ